MTVSETPADLAPLTETSSNASASAGTSDSTGEKTWERGPLYTFHCRRSDGSPVCLEMYELPSDERALVCARKLLSEHLTGAKIEIFEGERLVGAVAR